MNIKDLPQGSYKVINGQPAAVAAPSIGKINIKNLPQNSYKVISQGQTPSDPVTPPAEQSDQGILPYDKINEALKPSDIGNETSPIDTLKKTAGNQVKSAAKFGVGLVHFFDPVSIAKTASSAVDSASKYGTELEQQRQSEQGVKDYISQLQDKLQKVKQTALTPEQEAFRPKAQRIASLEKILKENGGAPLPDSGTGYGPDYSSELGKATVKTAVPPFIQKAVKDAKNAKTSDLAAYVPELNDPKFEGSHLEMGARILEGIHSALQSVAEDPQQLTPYALMAKKAIETKAPAVDKIISDIGSKPVDLVKTVAEKAIEPVRSAAENRAISGLAAKYKKVFTQFKSPTKAYNKSIQAGKDPASFGAENGYVVDVEKGKINSQPTIDKVKTEFVQPRNELVSEMIKAYDKTVPEWEKFKLDDLAAEAKNNVRLNPQIKGSGNLSSADKAIDRIVTELKTQYGDKVTYSDLHDIKNSQWNESSAFDLSKPKFEGDVNYALGRAAKDAIEVNVKSAPIKKLNAEVGDAQDFIKNLQKVDKQSSPSGAKMTSLFGKTIGAIAGSSAGPFGSVAGIIAGKYITELLQNNSIAGPIKRAILKSVEPNSALYEQAQTALKELESMPAAPESGVVTKQTIKPADLPVQNPLNPDKFIKVNQYNKPYPRYITPDQLKEFGKLLDLEENSRKVNNMKARFEGSTVKIRRGIVPMNDVNNVSFYKRNINNAAPIEESNKPFDQIRQESQDFENKAIEENNQALANEAKRLAYSDWPQNTRQIYTQFKKIFNAWKDNPEDYAQLGKTEAGQKIKQQIYNAARELNITENEVFEMFKDRIILESKKPSFRIRPK